MEWLHFRLQADKFAILKQCFLFGFFFFLTEKDKQHIHKTFGNEICFHIHTHVGTTMSDKAENKKNLLAF